MHGCKLRCAGIGAISLLLLLAGCDTHVPPPATEPEPPVAELGSAFDPGTAGSIRGRVTWEGEVPNVPGMETLVTGLRAITHPNPNAPAIHPSNMGVRDVVVYLRGVDNKRARPWDHPPVRIEMHDHRYTLHQGEGTTQRGFVRRGDEIEMTSTQPVYHALRATGSAFFTLPFPDPDKPLSRRLNNRGIVEITSGAEYYWMRCYLFVDDHPYYTRTDFDGSFELPDVPAGEYQLVCWSPSWHKARHERNPETAEIMRWVFKSPVELTRTIQVISSMTSDQAFVLSQANFNTGATSASNSSDRR